MESLRDKLSRLTRHFKESLGMPAPRADDRASRALVISDDPHAPRWVADDADPDWEAFLTADAAEAIESLGVDHYDLIVVDLKTPGTSPTSLVQDIRALRQVPIVVAAPRAERSLIADALAAGADDHVYADGNRDLARFLVRHAVDRVRLSRGYQEERPDTGRDFLTGADSQRAFSQIYAECVARSRQTGESLVVIRLAVDALQTINAAYGAHAGDVVLQEVTRMLRRAVRATDTVARLGAGQFAILLPGADRGRAEQVATQIHALASEQRFPERPDLRVQLRLGWAALGNGVSDPLHAAEQRLHAAEASAT